MRLPGPDQTVAIFSIGQFGWGAMVLWTPVANATAYRIYRMATANEPGVLRATVSSTDASRLLPQYQQMMALDPDPGARYWVEAVFSDGSSSEPGTVTDLQVDATNIGVHVPPVPNLTVTIGGTTTVTTRDGQQVRGNKLTWNWDRIPNPGMVQTNIYWATILVASSPPTVFVGYAYSLYHTEIVRASEPPYAVMAEGGVLGPPYSLSLPAGSVVKFCIANLPTEQLVTKGQYTDNWSYAIVCANSLLPP